MRQSTAKRKCITEATEGDVEKERKLDCRILSSIIGANEEQEPEVPFLRM